MLDIAKVKERLGHFGYTTTDTDDPMLAYGIASVEAAAKMSLGLTTPPAKAVSILTDKVVGEFFLFKKNTGQDIGINLERLVTSQSMGDVSVSFKAEDPPEVKVDKLIKYLINGRDGILHTQRSLAW